MSSSSRRRRREAAARKKAFEDAEFLRRGALNLENTDTAKQLERDEDAFNNPDIFAGGKKGSRARTKFKAFRKELRTQERAKLQENRTAGKLLDEDVGSSQSALFSFGDQDEGLQFGELNELSFEESGGQSIEELDKRLSGRAQEATAELIRLQEEDFQAQRQVESINTYNYNAFGDDDEAAPTKESIEQATIERQRKMQSLRDTIDRG